MSLGRPPTPTAKLALRGSWLAKTRHGEPRPAVARLRAPSWLRPEAQAIFRTLARQLFFEGIVTRIDERALARYADLSVRYLAASRFLDEHGDINPDTQQLYPQANRLLTLSAELTRLEDRFGLSPSARVRLAAPRAASTDRAVIYFGGRGGER